jgi:MFS family permease
LCRKATVLYTSTFIRMSLTHLFLAASFGTFYLLPLFIVGHGGSKADTGILMGAFGLSSVICRPWISNMIDRMGRKKTYTLGTLIMATLPLAYLPFEGELRAFYLPLLLVRIVHGVGLAMVFTAALTYISDIIPDDRLNEGIGMFGVTGLAGLALGPALAELIIRGYGFPAGFLYAAFMAAIGLVLQLPLPEPYVRETRTSSQSFFSVLRRRRTVTVALVALLFGLGLSASGTFVAPYAKEKQIVFISLYYISYSSAAILTRLFGGRLADRLGEERIIPNALLVMGTGLLLLLFLKGTPILALSGFLAGCGHGLLFPCLNALVIRNQPAEIRGKVTGVFTGSIDTGFFIGSIVLGYIGEWAGFRALFLASALALFAGFGAWNWSVWRSGRRALGTRNSECGTRNGKREERRA